MPCEGVPGNQESRDLVLALFPWQPWAGHATMQGLSLPQGEEVRVQRPYNDPGRLEKGQCLGVPLSLLAGAPPWDVVLMGLATGPVWGKVSGFLLVCAQVGGSSCNNKGNKRDSGEEGTLREQAAENECMKGEGRGRPSVKHLLCARTSACLVSLGPRIHHDEEPWELERQLMANGGSDSHGIRSQL